ncbi:glycosyl hydrolase family 71-domain-containing protein [Xylariales sp. PMI_506]|nr:glycosyl hydrolase family 71-domain-containing protein [Xylariales sp. PMI_506]
MAQKLLQTFVIASTAVVRIVQAREVYAHYMLGTLDSFDHADLDVQYAAAMGFDAFSLNIGDPTQDFIEDAMTYLFESANDRAFGLFVSMDVYASGTACYTKDPTCDGVYTCFEQGIDGCNGPFDYQWIWDGFKGNAAYHTYNGLPIITSFSSGGFNDTTWLDWKEGLANDMYFIPDFDETDGYYDSADAWWTYWGPVMDGLCSWESAWPERAGYGGAYPGDVSPDLPVLSGAHSHDKLYMMPLSPLQYKDSYGANVYRQGDETLPARMANILAMDPLPDFILFQTWNDGPESHYIGNLWPEQNTDAQPAAYSNNGNWSHAAWRPLVASFITAFKNGDSAAEMTPPTNIDDFRGTDDYYSTTVMGAIWYKTILVDSIVCPLDGKTLYNDKPSGFENGTNTVYFATVLDPEADPGYTIKIYTVDGAKVAATIDLDSGLTYGSSGLDLSAGAQYAEILDPSGNVVAYANGGLCVSSDCPSGIYNSNYQVLPFIGVLDTDIPTPTCQAWPEDDTSTSSSSSATDTPYVVWLSDNSVSIGAANNLTNADGTETGVYLQDYFFSGLVDICPEPASDGTPTSCDNTTPVTLSNVENGEDNLDITFTVNDSSYNTTEQRDIMLAASVATWQIASLNACDKETYTENGATQLECEAAGGTYIPGVPDGSAVTETGTCELSGYYCAAPNSISTVYGEATDPAWDSHLDIDITATIDEGGEFICELLEDLTILANSVSVAVDAIFEAETAPFALAYEFTVKAECG